MVVAFLLLKEAQGVLLAPIKGSTKHKSITKEKEHGNVLLHL
uniref:Uncharacterized protein n=1 Tax=Arundo donax TaxID=35708 RepID=A0A0A8YSL1_ARUDO